MDADDTRWTQTLRELAQVGRQAGPCPEAAALVRFAQDEAEPDEAVSVNLHVTACLACALTVDSLLGAKQPGKGALPGPVSPTFWRAAGEAAEQFKAALADLVTWQMPSCVAVVARDAGTVDARVTGALDAYRAEEWETARVALQALVDDGAAPPETLHFLGACIVRQGRPEEALDLLRRAAEARPRIGMLRVLLAEALLLCGRGEEALRELTRAARKAGEHQGRAKALVRQVKAVLADSH